MEIYSGSVPDCCLTGVKNLNLDFMLHLSPKYVDAPNDAYLRSPCKLGGLPEKFI